MKQEEPIYLDNIKLAYEMEKAGFNKVCVFRLRKHYISFTGKYYYTYDYGIFPHRTVIMLVDGEEAEKISAVIQIDVIHILYLPTLGEIELPEGMCIYQNSFGEWHIDSPVVTSEYPYPTELEARCHAWLWANENKKEVSNA